MFGTLRYIPNGRNPGYVVQRSTDRVPGRGGDSGDQHLACDRCRMKKLKCSGQKPGCNRCTASSSTCQYLLATKQDGSRKRGRRTSTVGSATRSWVESPSASLPSLSTAPPSPHHDQLPTSTRPASISESSVSGSIPTEERPQSNSGELNASRGQSNMIDMPDWSDVLNSEDNLDVSHLLDFGPEKETNLMDDDFSMSNFVTSASFDINARLDNDTISDIAVNGTNESTFKPLSSTHPASGEYSIVQCTSPASSNMSSVAKPQISTQPLVRQGLVQYSPSPSINLPTPLSSSAQENFTPTSRRNNSSDSCQCLQVTASVLEEIEAKILSVNSMSIDGMMNFHQEMLAQCNSVLLCGTCTSRSERMMLLAMACEKLANLCEKASIQYMEDVQDPEANSISTSSPPLAGDIRLGAPKETKRSGLGVISAPQKVPYCGEYKVEQWKEWVCLLKVLICLQLKALERFLNRMKLASYITRRETHLSMLNFCDKRVKKNLQNLQKA